MSIFKVQELKKPSVFQKVLKRSPKENAIIEINNLLAQYQDSLEDLQLEDILNITKKYKLNLGKKFKYFRLDLFQQYIDYCLEDKKLDEDEIRSFEHLKGLLFLSDSEIKQIIKHKAEQIFQWETQKAVQDGKLDKKELEVLETLKKALLISDDIAESMLEQESRIILQNFIDGAISDQRLSEVEEKRMYELAHNLNIEVKHSDKTKRDLEKFKLYWQIENGILPVIISSINIQKSESLHFQTSVKWLEQRTVTKRINYGGPTARIKLAKGVYYNLGSMATNGVTEDVWKIIDSGTLYLTNKRLIFMGSKGNKTIHLSKILDYKPYSNGVDIQKDTGKSPFLEFTFNVDIFSMMLARLLNDR